MVDLEEAKRVCESVTDVTYGSQHEERMYLIFACNHFKEAVAEIERLLDQQDRIRDLLEVHEMFGEHSVQISVAIHRILDEVKRPWV